MRVKEGLAPLSTNGANFRMLKCAASAFSRVSKIAHHTARASSRRLGSAPICSMSASMTIGARSLSGTTSRRRSPIRMQADWGGSARKWSAWRRRSRHIGNGTASRSGTAGAWTTEAELSLKGKARRDDATAGLARVSDRSTCAPFQEILETSIFWKYLELYVRLGSTAFNHRDRQSRLQRAPARRISRRQ